MPNLGTVNTTTSIATSAELAAANPMTTAGDLIVGGASGALARLAKGSDGQVLTVDPTTHLLVWATPSGGGTFATPAIVLGTAAAEGAASTGIRSDATLLAFDATAPAAIGTAAVGAATVAGRRDHVHATGAGTPSTQAFGDAAATGSGPAAAMTDHKHAMPASPGAGALVLLEQYTASASASLNFTTCISSTYDEYQIEFISIIPATDAAVPYLRMGTGGGPTYDTGANYSWAVVNCGMPGGVSAGAAGSGVGAIQLFNAGLSSSLASSWSLKLFNPGSTSVRKLVSGTGVAVYSTGPVPYIVMVGGSYNSNTAVTAFQFLFSTGNIASGTIRVYGIAKT